MKKIIRKAVLGSWMIMAWHTGVGQVSLPRIFSSGMVLQRDEPVRIWGWASPNEKVTIKINKATYAVTTEGNKRWSILLPAMKAGGPYNVQINGINHIELRNVYFGDVWICSGQSNMEQPVEKLKEKYAALIARAENPEIRQYAISAKYNTEGPLDDLSSGKWEGADPQTVLSFSATAWFFARALYEKYHVPIGLIRVAVGGTPVEAWMSEGALRSYPDYLAKAEQYRDTAWTDSIRQAEKAGGGLWYTRVRYRQPMGLYNAMIAPLNTFVVKGVLLYQGEADLIHARDYRQLFPAMVRDLRLMRGDSKLPVVFAQLSGYNAAQEQPAESDWALLREAQRKALAALPRSGMAVTFDLGQAGEFHPSDKEGIGNRLALAAEKVAYDEKHMISFGPLYQSCKIQDDRVVIRFNNTSITDERENLLVKGGGELKGFTIAGADKKFVRAKARITEKEVVVWSDAVPHPVAVRYGWADNPAGANLANKEGLPAAPFGTDD